MTQSWRSLVFHVVAVALFLVPAGVGFTVKYLDLLVLFGAGEEGAFAIVPIMNYLLSSLGFFMLFFWAVRHGMFRDIERTKVAMLETERELDAIEKEEKEIAVWK
ncbi:MAG TPA: hypothetical protein VFE62_13500 [Gemmataceae bacterium]|nr:hypothetical protein [Gemmataceae bacterium]